MKVMFKSKNGRKIPVTGKGHHLEKWSAEKRKEQKFNQVKDMVDKKANKTASSSDRKEIKFISNNEKYRWEAKHDSGINLFIIVISRIGKKWFFSIFSHEKGCWKNSEDLSAKSLCSTLKFQFE